MTKPAMTRDDLRGMVREVLRDVLPPRASSAPQGKPASVEPVQIADDRDLQAFVARLLDGATLERVRSGGLRFTLAGSNAAATAPVTGAPLSGVVTEHKINQFRSSGTLVLAPGAVLTPLARDRARALGLKIERRS